MTLYLSNAVNKLPPSSYHLCTYFHVYLLQHRLNMEVKPLQQNTALLNSIEHYFHKRKKLLLTMCII